MDDLEYLRRRAAQEDRAARFARSQEAEMIHRVLSTHYARRAVAEILMDGGVSAHPSAIHPPKNIRKGEISAQRSVLRRAEANVDDGTDVKIFSR